jgi:uncharacterized glyoxalase superfamily protein PhnB
MYQSARIVRVDRDAVGSRALGGADHHSGIARIGRADQQPEGSSARQGRGQVRTGIAAHQRENVGRGPDRGHAPQHGRARDPHRNAALARLAQHLGSPRLLGGLANQHQAELPALRQGLRDFQRAAQLTDHPPGLRVIDYHRGGFDPGPTMRRAASMSSSYKPEGYTTISPYLIVDGASRTIDFLVRALDAVELRRFAADDGRVLHAEVRIDDSVVMLSDGAEDWPPIASQVHVYVPDVDAAFKRALAEGAKAVQEPVKGQDEDKRGGVVDAGGTTWWLSTRVG